MDYDVESETTSERSPIRRVGGVLRSLVSYALFALGILAFWSFFAPFLDVPALAWHAVILPEIVAPTEGDAIVNVTPLIAGVVTCVAGVWLR
ncbi:hypothetical protein [Halorubrum tibetense]|uniref:Uncharacterized protein n=1 Tax=Halorubrum tibetense TaxID=175631 RepID=A0ABD5S929_9EURY